MLDRLRNWSLARLFVVVGVVAGALALAVWVGLYLLLGEDAVLFFLLWRR